MKKLNNYIFLKRAKIFLSENIRKQRFVNYEFAKAVLILFESDYSEKNPYIRKIISMMQQDGKKVVAWGFIDKKEITTSILPDFRILHHQQTDFFHKPIISYCNELQAMEFDLLIDLTLRPILPLQYLAMYANVSCKTAMKNTELPIYDFIIDLENLNPVSESEENTENPIDEEYLFNQIIFYLKNIQTND